MKVFKDILDFISSLKFVDYVFLIACIVLIILIVTLIYFIKINKDEKESNEVKEETAEMKIVDEIKKNLDKETNRVVFTDFEKDQEDRAIISYEELLDKNKNGELNYEKEEMQDDLLIKKVNLEDIVSREPNASYKSDVRVISFEKEEAFLKALKRLQKELR